MDQHSQAQSDREIAALREILQLISRHRDDEQPVLDAITRNAARLCDAQVVGLSLANTARTQLRYASVWGGRHAFFHPDFTFDLDGPLQVARTVRDAKVIHTADLADDPLYAARDPIRVKMVDEVGVRTFLTVPLIRDGVALGCLNLNRKDVRPFSDSDIALLESFAAQAVIAIENTRQFREVQTRLTREAATSDVLRVINQSRTDAQPVFEAIHDNVSRLCDAPFSGLFLLNDAKDALELVSHRGGNPDYVASDGKLWPLSDKSAQCRAALRQEVVHVRDMRDTDAYRSGHAATVRAVEQEGIGTFLAVPLMKDGAAIGSIGIYRCEARAFSDDQVDLVQTFAAQAVIAIENVRQFREIQERLDRERASAEILSVISQSRPNEAPVFETILDNAARLCRAPHAFLMLRNAADTHLEVVAHSFTDSELITALRAAPYALSDRSILTIQVLHEARVRHIHDLSCDPAYAARTPQIRLAVEKEGVRTLLFVPLLKESQAIGLLGLFKHEVAPFLADDISLVETFAAQAIIAIENARQFRALADRTEEVQALNASLETKVADQVGEIERMGRLKRFLSPAVADAVVSAGDEAMLASHRALIATLFADMRGFTAFCETAEPEETIEVLQTFHEEMGGLIRDHNVGVDTRAGDGIMVIMGDPLPCEDPAGDALRLALAMRDKMAELSTRWKRLGHRLGFGVGLSLGYATVGMVGAQGRYDYTANGTSVNLAARLCDHASDGEILLSPRAYMAVEDVITAESLGDMQFKGIKAPVEVFRVTGPT